jgi:SHS2 domain-containing protein
MTRTENIKTWRKLEDGTMELVSDIDVEVDGPSNEELIAEKEAQLITIYTEIQKLKEKL